MFAALVLRMGPAPTPEPEPEMQAWKLDLAMFGPATPPDDGHAPAQADPAASPTPEPPPVPEPIATPPEPVPSPEPPPVPRAAPGPPPKLKTQPPPRENATPQPTTKPDRRPEPRPIARANPPPESRQKRREPGARTAPAPAPAPSRPKSEAPTKASPATAPGGSGGPAASQEVGPSPAARASAERAYLAELQRAIARYQRFPEDARRRRATGVATLAFAVQADGRIEQVRVVKSSGDAALDQAAVSALGRLGRFKPIPASIGRSSWPMRVPIRFDLR
jgi:protein TonB